MILLSTTTDKKETVSSIINREYRLKELVTVSSETPAGADMLVSNVIILMPDWNNLQPPVLFPPVTFNEDSLLGLIYAKLGNFEKAYQLLSSYPMLLNLPRNAKLLPRIAGQPLKICRILPKSGYVRSLLCEFQPFFVTTALATA